MKEQDHWVDGIWGGWDGGLKRGGVWGWCSQSSRAVSILINFFVITPLSLVNPDFVVSDDI